MVYLPLRQEDVNKCEIILTSGYGWRKLNGKRQFHDGIDLAPSINESAKIPIIASVSGVLRSFRPAKSGRYQQITPTNGEFAGWHFRTVHQEEFVKESGYVEAGEIIGYMGASGATAKHVHFEIYKPDNTNHVDPYSITKTYFQHITEDEMTTLKHPVGCVLLEDTRLLKDYKKGRSESNTHITATKGTEFDAANVATFNGVEFYSANISDKGKKYSGWIEADERLRQYPTSDIAGRHRIITLDRENRKLKAELETCLNEN